MFFLLIKSCYLSKKKKCTIFFTIYTICVKIVYCDCSNTTYIHHLHYFYYASITTDHINICKNKVINKFIVLQIMISPRSLEAVFSIMVVYNIPLKPHVRRMYVYNAYIKKLNIKVT